MKFHVGIAAALIASVITLQSACSSPSPNPGAYCDPTRGNDGCNGGLACDAYKSVCVTLPSCELDPDCADNFSCGGKAKVDGSVVGTCSRNCVNLFSIGTSEVVKNDDECHLGYVCAASGKCVPK
jgi:hypothetical protein